jgi:CHAD domain-containing protein
MLDAQYRAIIVNDPGTRLGEDAEALHQHRVAIRRLRAMLRAARPLLDRGWVDEVRGELAWAGRALGTVRDLDVLLEHLRADADALGAAERAAFETLTGDIGQRRDRARRSMLSDLRSTRYVRLLERLENELHDPPRSSEGDVSLEQIAGKVRKLGDDPTDDALHDVRRAAKRARYAAELAERMRGRPATRFVAAAKKLQDVLGEHQDGAVAEGVLDALAADADGRAVYVAGMLAERQRERRRDARAAFPRAWRRLRKRGRKAW